MATPWPQIDFAKWLEDLDFTKAMEGGESNPQELISKVSTLPKTNMSPEKGPFQKETSLPTIHFQVLC